jgi:hypothetical protein
MALQRLLAMDDLTSSMGQWASLLLKLCMGVFAFFSIYYIILTLYNLFFHPLRRFPGPRLARVSRLWSRIGNFQGRKSERIHQAHLKYGMLDFLPSCA